MWSQKSNKWMFRILDSKRLISWFENLNTEWIELEQRLSETLPWFTSEEHNLWATVLNSNLVKSIRLHSKCIRLGQKNWLVSAGYACTVCFWVTVLNGHCCNCNRDRHLLFCNLCIYSALLVVQLEQASCSCTSQSSWMKQYAGIGADRLLL